MQTFRTSCLILLALALAALQDAFADGQPPGTSLSVQPDTVLLLHGLGRSNTAMWLLASRLEDEGFLVERIGYDSLTRAPREILDDISGKIAACCLNRGRKLHFVGHSLGGLLIRAYLDDNPVTNLGRVVLIGTPNQGTAVVDRFRDSWWMQLLGPTTLALGTDEESFPNSLEPPYYPVGVIAGKRGLGLNDIFLPGEDDGLVTVDATKLEKMTDFVVVNSGHAYMRYSGEVATQTAAFLKSGRFLHREE